MKEILEKTNHLSRPPKVGEIIEGEVIGIEKASVFVDLGVWGTGIIYGREFFDAKERLKTIKIGDKVFAKIIDLENEEGYIELSIASAGKEIVLENLRQKKEKGETVKVKILKANKGGLVCEIEGLDAFLPVSQLSQEHYPKVEGGDTTRILRELQNFIGKELEVKILNILPHAGQVILSEKAREADEMKEILKNYKIGDKVQGEITGLAVFGAFMKFPLSSKASQKEKGASAGKGKEIIEGLIHISELDWKIVEDPSDVVKVGQKVKAQIIDISNGKVSLSLKALKKDPWEGIEKKYKKGDIVQGKVTKLNPFGAFVEILPAGKHAHPSIQGLCHISEFGSQNKIQDVLKIEKKYSFEILTLEPREHRMSLRLVEK